MFRFGRPVILSKSVTFRQCQVAGKRFIRLHLRNSSGCEARLTSAPVSLTFPLLALNTVEC